MNKSETIGALAKALVQAISEMENASKNSVNPHFKSKYADLAEVIATTKPTLQKYGLAVAQFPCFEGGAVGVETIILHDSGEWMSGTAYSPIPKQDPQAVGSAITYLRRYSLAAVCGLTQEDDDGHAATKPKTAAPKAETRQSTPTAPQAAPPKTMTEAQRKQIMSYFTGKDREWRLEWVNNWLDSVKAKTRNIKSFNELPEAACAALLKELETHFHQGAA